MYRRAIANRDCETHRCVINSILIHYHWDIGDSALFSASARAAESTTALLNFFARAAFSALCMLLGGLSTFDAWTLFLFSFAFKFSALESRFPPVREVLCRLPSSLLPTGRSFTLRMSEILKDLFLSPSLERFDSVLMLTCALEDVSETFPAPPFFFSLTDCQY